MPTIAPPGPRRKGDGAGSPPNHNTHAFNGTQQPCAHAQAVDFVAGGDLPARLGRPARRVLAGVRVATDYDYRMREYAAWLEWRLVPNIVVDDDMSGGSGNIAAAFDALRCTHRANRGRPRVKRGKSSHAGPVGMAAPTHSFRRRPDFVQQDPLYVTQLIPPALFK